MNVHTPHWIIGLFILDTFIQPMDKSWSMKSLGESRFDKALYGNNYCHYLGIL